MTVGELKAALAVIPDASLIAEIARVVREPIPTGAEPVPAAGPPVYVVSNDLGCWIWPKPSTPGEICLSVYEPLADGGSQLTHRSLGHYTGNWK